MYICIYDIKLLQEVYKKGNADSTSSVKKQTHNQEMMITNDQGEL